ncbi:histidinol dehydrogenase [Pseudoxanthomonas winnipegensis]|jgi:histidinol dehydrogenase|uniref:Histidinol dehydrogenase n=1 Tax=Pseudoxanthomonas winnipegensis TaxID=2480810 RepID=A0ABY1W9Z8_9GAMM|nr:histidinol dehydrogenase [Pseudoxanthomonas winnipegensis]TAA08676.1 histidinol dehydrogenase [Pseudoxanthomonas winnipegensis]TAA17043.1 histidinol dehydrogenase [Pseudoxanthomonas winnipegensis]TAH71968.1 histidinol dehydrogenase [Pseudoxanthomonas winnipegensis]
MNANLRPESPNAQRIVWNALDAQAQAQTLERPAQTVAEQTRRTVAALIEEVRSGGLDALRAITQRFDGAAPASFEVGEDQFAAAEAAIDPALKQAMVEAAARITAFHKAGMAQPYAVETAPGVVCERVIRPIGRVGLYVPAGSAPLPSTALMLGVPAQLAGCREVVLCTPPRKDGTADPAVLVAARLTGVSRVFVLGGAQAIAAMAYGAGPVPACDKLFGPGNSYVTEAKQQVAQSGAAAIDMPAGPSEVLVIADAGANADFVAADLLSQAEHGPDSQVLLLSDDAGLLDRVEAALAAQLAALPRADIARRALSASRLVQVQTLEEAFAISNRYAPEHLILALREPRVWLPRVEAAGSVFLGDYTPEALGDYCSGTNHVLPTSGAARAYSGVSVASFQNFVSVQSASAAGILAIGPSAVTLAEAESLEAHANAVRLRLAEAAR